MSRARAEQGAVSGADRRCVRRWLAALLVLLLGALLPAQARAREITDMVGRRVVVPDVIHRVAALSPPATALVYAFDPGLLVGINFPLWESERRFTAERYRSLPVIGGMVGNGRQVNVEVLLAARPDVVLLWVRDGPDAAVNAQFEKVLAPLRVPVVYVRFDALPDYPGAIAFLGGLLGRERRAAELNAYAEATLKGVAAVLAGSSARPGVYYAEGVDGLATDGEGSMHTQLIPLAGGRNVHRLPPATHMGMEAISLEQLLAYDPDVILVKEVRARAHILSDPRWRPLRAVREGRVLQIPHLPFNWFDRPPSFMRLLGLRWLAHALHPAEVPFDAVPETKRFYQLFLGVKLTDAEAEEVLCR
jgi:iron complex transport system substrate-binding protein